MAAPTQHHDERLTIWRVAPYLGMLFAIMFDERIFIRTDGGA
jgi:hypothetical protein